MRRCVVNLISGNNVYYRRGQKRIAAMMNKWDPETALLIHDSIPADWPSHKDKPYAFKSFALMEAAKDFDLLLWCDSSVVPIAPMGPLWERIERDGYFLVDGGGVNYDWTADSAYPDLFPGVPIEEARKINRTFKQIVGGIIGLNVRSTIGAEFLRLYYELAANTNAFCGPWANLNCPTRPQYGPSSSYTTAACGPPDVIGHRHDQTAASVLAWRMGLKLSQYPAPYAYTLASEETILLHDGPGLESFSSDEVKPLKPLDANICPCPNCNSKAVGMAGGMCHCNQCSYSF
jgi:hypothetical protein